MSDEPQPQMQAQAQPAHTRRKGESNEERRLINQRVADEFRANGGKVGGRYEGAPLLLLTTVGAKTGEERIAPLGYTVDSDRYVVIAARGGAPINPDWYFNLVAQPLVKVEVGTETFTARATVTSGEERQRLWSERAVPGSRLDSYTTKTTREIPVILLERVAPANAE